jgi:CubicO group peptidase (beta-lactamase class C family)
MKDNCLFSVKILNCLFLLLSLSVAQALWADYDATPTATPAATSDASAGEGTVHSLPSGASFIVPRNWSVSPVGDMSLLQDPDKALTVVYAEFKDLRTDDAIAATWTNLQLDFSHLRSHIREYPTDNDWDQITRIDYYQDPDVKIRIWGTARRKGKVSYVYFFMGSVEASDRRLAQSNIIFHSLKVQGAEGEVFKGRALPPLSPQQLKQFEDFVEGARARCRIPGVAMALVQNGKIIDEKGFGVREKDKDGKVTPQTLFMIGEITKPLTTLMMARLVDQNKFSWDTPVTEILPTFKLGDPQMTGKLNMEYTVCACAGFPPRNMHVYFDPVDLAPEEVLQRMSTIVPSTGFGETFQYSNNMVAAGGYIAAHILEPDKPLGVAYADAMQSQVLNPLGMKSTTLDFARVIQADYATPHGGTLDYGFSPVSLSMDYWAKSMAPAAGFWSNVEDMSNYMLLELSNGRTADGSVFVSEANFLKRRQPQVAVSDKDHYGLGIYIYDDHELHSFGHGGNTIGFTSSLDVFPDEGIGLVLLTNANEAVYFTRAVRRRLVEIIFNGNQLAQDQLDTYITQMDDSYQKNSIWIDHRPDRYWIGTLEGDYVNEDLGRVSIRETPDGAVFDTGKWKIPIASIPRGIGQEKGILLTDSPFTWMEIIPDDKDDSHQVLTLQTPQKNYLFERVSTGTR